MRLALSVLPETLAVCRLPSNAEIPSWAVGENLLAFVRTDAELSVVCLESRIPEGIQREAGWKALKVQGPLDFSLIGILADLAAILAKAGVSIFAISTYDTDYVLVKEVRLEDAIKALAESNYTLER